ncbi:MAG: SLBB domain-containing protein [Armatimonadota bacterium]|nr:SLBB domain-containing protein [Armatimonadota bacterium]
MYAKRCLASILAVGAAALALAVFSHAQSLGGTYRLGPGDVVEVSVWGFPDLTRTAAVRPDGRLSLPLVGEVEASGRTLEDLRAELTRRFARFVRNPQVAVILKELRRVRVGVLGQVGRPGTLELTAPARVLDALSAAGGLLESADPRAARLIRANGTVVELDLERAVQGDASYNPPVDTGDVLVVPEDVNGFVFVLGEVNRPGMFRLKTELRVLEALALAGGLTEKAGVGRAYVVRNRSERVPLDLAALLTRGDQQQNIVLQRGDVVFIPEDLENRVYVLGDVNRPGVFALAHAPSVLAALTQAGGVNLRTQPSEAFVLRRSGSGGAGMEGSSVVRIRVDLEALLRGDVSRDVRLQPGDVVFVPQGPLGLLELMLSILTGVRRWIP